jgi:hypothetical protein
MNACYACWNLPELCAKVNATILDVSIPQQMVGTFTIGGISGGRLLRYQ